MGADRSRVELKLRVMLKKRFEMGQTTCQINKFFFKYDDLF
jgi:hypothetical protein